MLRVSSVQAGSCVLEFATEEAACINVDLDQPRIADVQVWRYSEIHRLILNVKDRQGKGMVG
jgi:hypothetical protein